MGVNDVFDDPDSAESLARQVTWPSPAAPMAVARQLVELCHQHDDKVLTLRHWRGGWWWWLGPRWSEVEDRAVRSRVYRMLEGATYVNGDGKVVEWAPTRRKVADVLDALAAVCHLPETTDQPSWTEGAGTGGVIVACDNGLLHVASRTLLAHDPRYFNSTAVPFDFDPDASAPARWLAFVEAIWSDDPESIVALQQWFGYVISGRLDLHKILLWVGPTRGGKGATARVLGALVGPSNVAGPTLPSLGTDFGLAPLLGKSLAVVSDARLSGRNTSSVVERLLNISGEDSITVNRKYRDQWTGKLPARFILLSNELPAFGDSSAAIVGRFVILQSHQSWLGNEDPTLEDGLHAELTGILNWSLDGLAKLTEKGRFTRPKSTDEAVTTLQDLASPVAAFVRDKCTVDPLVEVPCHDLFTAWKTWADDNGHRAGSAQVFGRNMRAALPSVRVARPREDEARVRVYLGVTLDPQCAGPRTTADQTAPGPQSGPNGSGENPRSEHVVRNGPHESALWVQPERCQVCAGPAHEPTTHRFTPEEATF